MAGLGVKARREGRTGFSELRPGNAGRARPMENFRTGRAELELAADETGDDPASIWNILLTQAHDVGCTGRLILLGLRECRPRSHRQCGDAENELFHVTPPC